MLHGALPEQWANVADAPHLWRKAPFILLLACLLVFGCFPSLLTDKIQASVSEKVLLTAQTARSDGSSRRKGVLPNAGARLSPAAAHPNLSCGTIDIRPFRKVVAAAAGDSRAPKPTSALGQHALTSSPTAGK
jgi:hypothetical protein